MDYDFNMAIENVRELITKVIGQFQDEVHEILIENQRFYTFQGEDSLCDLGVRISGIDNYLEENYYENVFLPTKRKLENMCDNILEHFERMYNEMEQYARGNQIDNFENSLKQIHYLFTNGKIIRNDFNLDYFQELQSTVGKHYLNSMPFDPMENGYQELNNSCKQAAQRFFDQMDDLNHTLQNYANRQLSSEIDMFLLAKEEMMQKQKQEEKVPNPKEEKVEEKKTEEKIETSASKEPMSGKTPSRPITPPTGDFNVDEAVKRIDAKLEEAGLFPKERKKEEMEKQQNQEEAEVEISATSEQSEKKDEQETQIEEQAKTNDLPETQTVEDQKTNDDDIRAQQLLEQEEKIRELEKLVAEQEARIAEKNQKIVELEENRRELSTTIDHAEQQITALNQRVDELTAREQEKDQEMQRLKEDNELLTRHNGEKSEMITTLQNQIKEMGQAQKEQSQPKELTPEEDLEQTYQLLHSFSDEQKQAFYKSSKSQEALEDLLLLKMKESVQPSHQELLDELILTLLDGRSSVTVEEDKMGIGHK